MSFPNSNAEFLKAIFGEEYKRAHVTGFNEDPGQLSNLGLNHYWGGGCFNRMAPYLEPEDNNYFTVSLFEPDPKDGLSSRRRKDLFEAAYCLVIDDVGTKIDMDAFEDNNLLSNWWAWILETSPGNYQYGYIFDKPVTQMGWFDAVVDAIIRSGLCEDNKDPGMRGVTRYARLPFGSNTKGGGSFQCKISGWDDDYITIKGLAEAFDVDLSQVDPAGVQGKGAGGSAALPPEHDAVYSVLEDTGKIIRNIRDGVWEIECPWVGSHTGREQTGAAYMSPNGFKCHHGHCQDRTFGDLNTWLEDNYAGEYAEARVGVCREEFEDVNLDNIMEVLDLGVGRLLRKSKEKLKSESNQIQAAARVSASRPGDLDSLFERYVFLSRDDRYWDRERRIDLSRPAFKAECAQVMPKKNIQAFDHDPRKISVDGLVYWPGKGISVHEAPFEYRENIWRPSRAQQACGGYRGKVSDKDIEPWLDLVSWVIRDKTVRGWFLDWCAFVIQRQDQKPGHHWVIQGKQGVGKDMLMRPMEWAVGMDNTGKVLPGAIGGGFNDYLQKRLIIVNEMKTTTRGTATAHDVYNALKQQLDNTSLVVTINAKFKREYTIPNVSCWYFTTNEDVPISIDVDDRRLAIWRCERPKREPGFYEKIQELYGEAGFAEKFTAWMLDRKLGAGDVSRITGPAPETKAKRDLVLASRDEFEIWAAEKIETGVWPDLIPGSEVMWQARQARQNGELRYGVDRGRLGRCLRKLGCEQVYRGNPVVYDAGQGQGRVWAVRNTGRYLNLGQDEIQVAYKNALKKGGETAPEDVVGKVVEVDFSNVGSNVGEKDK